MSLIDLASMVLAPTAVKDGKVYNAIPNDQDFTFSRGTEATRVNSAGLIEKARTNFLLQSNSFNTTWVTANSSITSGQSGYDGSNDAWLLDKSGASGRITQTKSVTGIFTFSVYVKKGTTDWILLYKTGTGEGGRFFDLTNGVTGSSISTAPIDSKIESIGNDWYRCSIVGNSATAVVMYVADSDGSLTDTSGSIYIQDAQLEQGLVSTDYIDTTTSSVTVGITDDLPRVDYSGGGCPSLLLEPSRTQLLTQSEYYSGSTWIKQSGTTVTQNTTDTLSPEGKYNASKVTSNGSNGLFHTVAYSGGGANTKSIYLKGVSGGEVVYLKDPYQTVSTKSCTLTTEWQRFTLSETQTSSTSLWIDDIPSGGIYMWGAMLELGSYVSSYLPSYGTSTSRSADSCSLTNASNLFNNDTAVWLIDIERMGIDSTDIGDSLTLKDGSNVRQITLWFDAPTEQIRFRDGKNSFTTIGSSGGVIGTPAGERKKIALKIDGTTLKVFADGIQKGSNYTRPTAFDFTKMDMTGIGYKIKNVQFYTTALTDAQVIELTK